MVKPRILLSALGAFSLSAGLLQAQTSGPVAPRPGPVPIPGVGAAGTVAPAPIDPVIETPAPHAGTNPQSTSTVAVPAPATGGVPSPQANQSFDIQGDPIGLVLGSLARQAGINISVSEKVTGPVTMRLDNMTARDAIDVIVTSRGLFMDEQRGVYYVKTAE